MKKTKLFIILIIFITVLSSNISLFKVEASTSSYKTFSEIIMSEGKLLCNFTKKETESAIKKTNAFRYSGVEVYMINKNVKASYISNTLFSTYNEGDTPLTYEVQVIVETNNKVTLDYNCDNSIKLSPVLKSIKAEIGGKTGIGITSSSTKSVTDKRTLKLTVNPNNRCIVYLTGDLTISNGAYGYYLSFVKLSASMFEICVLNNQYAHYEIKPIFKDINLEE